MADWTFLTNHAHVLLCVARDPGIRHRDVAGYLERTREGRRNRYRLERELPLRHPLEHDHHIGEILAVLQRDDPPADG